MATNETVRIVQRVKTDIDNYEATVQALHAFIGVTIWEDGQFTSDSHHALGRRMETSGGNRFEPSTTVTPDAVIQQAHDFGYVVEGKASLSSDQEHWTDDVEQLHKYDDDLLGWWTADERIGNNDVVLLIRAPLAADFVEYTERLDADRGWAFTRNMGYVEFNRIARVSPALHLRLHEGVLTDDDIRNALQKGQMVPLEGLVATFRARRFYDSPPPCEYLMEALWQGIFNEMKSEVAYDHGLKCWPLYVHVGNLTRELQKLYGSEGQAHREVEYPRTAWVGRALEALVQIGLAQPGVAPGEYTILFRRILGDVIETFARHRSDDTDPAEPGYVQLELPTAQ